MDISKAERRDKKKNKRNRMIVSNRSILTIQAVIVKKGKRVHEKSKDKTT